VILLLSRRNKRLIIARKSTLILCCADRVCLFVFDDGCFGFVSLMRTKETQMKTEAKGHASQLFSRTRGRLSRDGGFKAGKMERCGVGHDVSSVMNKK